MKYNISKNWIGTFELIKEKPVIILPFMFLAFLEGLAFEVACFFSRKPISFIANPIIRKFFGERFLHYPDNLILLPKLFYFIQIAGYVVIGVFLTAISINIFKNIKSKLPLRVNALIKNAASRYLSFFTYGALIIALFFLLRKLDLFILLKFFNLTSKYMPGLTTKSAPFIMSVSLYLTNIILNTFLVLMLPMLVMEKRTFLKALGGSVYMGARNFLTLFTLIFVPFLVYFPISLLKNFSTKIVEMTFPEINIFITIAGILAAMFIDCFIIICASQFLMDVGRAPER